MRIHFLTAAMITLLLIPFSAAGTADVVGTWDCEMYVEANAQTHPFKLVISDVNGSLEGSASSEMGSVVLESLKYESSQLTFEIYLAEAGTIKFDLKISGKELAGTGGNYDFAGQVKGKKE